jgi:hypothetical protein
MANKRLILEEMFQDQLRRATFEESESEQGCSNTPHWDELKDTTGRFTMNFAEALVLNIIPSVFFILAVFGAVALYFYLR